ncbi:MAG: hypothetical protein LBU90_10765 [Bacteroidales bacterium]|jgi:hypothetical protein|nr:hypothetical protein [Bacteroidales bacterium]
MKFLKYLCTAVFSVLLFSTCEDYEFLNLKRDNPLDAYYKANEQDGIALVFNSYNMYADNNNNKIANKGETIKLSVSLKNTGSRTAYNVTALFSTTSVYVSGFSPATYIGYGYSIYAGYTAWEESTFAFQCTISNSTPANTVIPFAIEITDSEGHRWTDSFTITVY